MNQLLLYREFGLALATERRRRKLSQTQFGAKVGLSRTSITNIECGRQPIQLHQLYLFASMLGINISKLLPKEGAFAETATHNSDDNGARFLAEASNLLDRNNTRRSSRENL